MKIKKMISQSRRDFVAEMECEFCNDVVINKHGYDDANYHQNVIPNMKCGKCEKSTVSEGGTPEPREPKYPPGYVI